MHPFLHSPEPSSPNHPHLPQEILHRAVSIPGSFQVASGNEEAVQEGCSGNRVGVPVLLAPLPPPSQRAVETNAGAVGEEGGEEVVAVGGSFLLCFL